jgi:[citrate (pro-3S)-lyase] ligase
MVTELLSSGDRQRARELLRAQGLSFEAELDDLVGVFEGEALVAVGARAREVLKMLAIDPARQSGSLLGELVGELVQRGFQAGHESLFVFTRPEYVTSFEALNFELLVGHGRVALLEYGRHFARWLEEHRPLVAGDANGAVVVNCNPFTLGHQHLVEEAARRSDVLYVFVVREDRSAFPFDVRRRLVEEGTRHLPNVRVLDTSRYAVSAVTFPAYFLHATDDAATIQMELDAQLFAERIAPFFRVRRRFFGQEPISETTRRYNEAMKRLLPVRGVEAVEIERCTAAGGWISASRVRAALARGELAGLEALVPGPTLAYLRSDESRAVRERLRDAAGGA